MSASKSLPFPLAVAGGARAFDEANCLQSEPPTQVQQNHDRVLCGLPKGELDSLKYAINKHNRGLEWYRLMGYACGISNSSSAGETLNKVACSAD